MTTAFSVGLASERGERVAKDVACACELCECQFNLKIGSIRFWTQKRVQEKTRTPQVRGGRKSVTSEASIYR